MSDKVTITAATSPGPFLQLDEPPRVDGELLAIDPGPEFSALVQIRAGLPITFGKYHNSDCIETVKTFRMLTSHCIIEQIASYGMAVGAEVFETCYWSGRFAQAYGADRVHRIPRLKVKLHLCRDSRAKDANIRQALIDRFGGNVAAIGSKKAPGPLYGMAGDCWSALAVGLTFAEGVEK